MDVLITFKVSKDERAVRDAMRKLGYYSNWKESEKSYELPDSCVWKPDTGLVKAKSDLLKITTEMTDRDTTFKLISSIIVYADPWTGVPKED